MQITHDIHTHTLHSSCCFDPAATVRNYIRKAQELGHTVLGLSDHLWDEAVPGASGWYSGQTLQYVLEAKDSIPADTGHLRVLFGAEAEYCTITDTLAITADDARAFDYILIPHTHTHMRNFVMPEPQEISALRCDYEKRMQACFPELSGEQICKMCGTLGHQDLYPAVQDCLDFPGFVSQFLLDSLESLLNNREFQKLADVLPVLIAHPVSPCEARTVSVEAEQRLDWERLRVLCEKAAAMNLIFDINMCGFRMPENGYRDDPMVRVMQIARDTGVRFACGTDAHSVKALEDIRKAEVICSAIGLRRADFADFVRPAAGGSPA